MRHSLPMHRAAIAAPLAVFVLICATACRNPKPAPVLAQANTDAALGADAGPLEPPRIPSEPTKFNPSLVRVAPDEQYDLDTHMETELCSQCHEQIVDEWSGSAHAFASMSNPYYRVSFDQFVKDTGRTESQHCAGCHDPTLMFDDSIHSAIEPTDRRAHIGVTCNTCHGITEATADGNASYLLSTAPVPVPKDGDPDSLASHKARLGMAALRTNEMCAACHEGFFTPNTGHGAVIGGLDDFTAYRRSGYGGNPVTRIDVGVEQKSCTDCHMQRGGADNLPSHRFAGGHSALATTIGSSEQLAAITDMVKGAATVDIGAVGVGDVDINRPAPTALKEGDRVWADVVVYNSNTGHTFPAGALDLRDTWIEVVLEDANGEEIAGAGREHEETGTDPSAVQLRAVVASKEGELVKGHRVHMFRAAVAKHAVDPRDALVSRYTYEVGEKVPSLPLTVRVKLRHRRLHRSMTDNACEDSKTDLGTAYRAQTKKFFKVDVDPCREQPIIDIGAASAQLGGTERTPADKPQWRRYWERGLGLMHNVQENLPEAIESFEAALAKLPDDAPKEERARVLFSLGLTAAEQGRTQDAMDYWAKVEQLVGPTAAVHFARGNAHQKTFHNAEATQWYLQASKLVDDDRVWRQLAISAGSSDQPRIAYDAARAGLVHEPRDANLLRSQMLALRKIGAEEPEWQKAATDAFTAYKRDEAAPSIRDLCSAADPYCRDEREPMRLTELK